MLNWLTSRVIVRDIYFVAMRSGLDVARSCTVLGVSTAICNSLPDTRERVARSLESRNPQ